MHNETFRSQNDHVGGRSRSRFAFCPREVCFRHSARRQPLLLGYGRRLAALCRFNDDRYFVTCPAGRGEKWPNLTCLVGAPVIDRAGELVFSFKVQCTWVHLIPGTFFLFH